MGIDVSPRISTSPLVNDIASAGTYGGLTAIGVAATRAVTNSHTVHPRQGFHPIKRMLGRTLPPAPPSYPLTTGNPLLKGGRAGGSVALGSVSGLLLNQAFGDVVDPASAVGIGGAVGSVALGGRRMGAGIGLATGTAKIIGELAQTDAVPKNDFLGGLSGGVIGGVTGASLIAYPKLMLSPQAYAAHIGPGLSKSAKYPALFVGLAGIGAGIAKGGAFE